MKTVSTIVMLLVSGAMASTVQTALAQPFDLSWHTIDGGGGTSTGGTFSLSGTIGQPDAGSMTGGSFTLIGGYWVNDSNVACKPNWVTGTGCLGPTDLLGFLNMYFVDFDGHGSGVPGNDHTLPQLNPNQPIYSVPCSAAQQSASPPVVTAFGLKADYDGDCQITPSDLLSFLSEYFNPTSDCFSGCFTRPVASEPGPATNLKSGSGKSKQSQTSDSRR